ncbi:MAG: hypothetical protein ACI88H_002104 [Cocleimonas sp.]|jgi:hypothetical protein
MNNNTKNSNSDIPKELLELVPWYAIGKLSVDDQAFFDKALVEYPLLEELVTQELQIIETVSVDNSLLDLSAIGAQEERLKSVFNMIDIAEAEDLKSNQANNLSTSNSLLDKLKSFLGLSINSDGMPQYSRAASVAVLVLSVAALTAFITPLFDDKSDFIPASAVSQPSNDQNTLTNASKTVLLVGFKGTSRELGDNNVIKGKLSKIESVPDKEGIYQISFNKIMSTAETQKTIDALLAQKELIWFAGEEF